jgi:hypothetical protein
MEAVKFVYLGEDQQFIKSIQGNLDEFYKDLGIQIDVKSLKSMKEARAFIVNKETQLYKLFIVDFSANYDTYIFVARTLGTQNNYKTIPMMGLTGVENPDDHFLGGIFAGCKAIFIKGIEYSAAVNFAIQLYNPKFVRPINWPSGEFSEDEADCFAGFKLNYFSKDYLHAETNLSLTINEEIILNTEIANKMGVSKFKVVREHNTNHYYNLKRIYDLEILANTKRIEPNLGLIDPEKREPPGKVEGKALEIFLEFKRKLEKWIFTNIKKSSPKLSKLVVIDQDLTIYNQLDKNPDKFPFHLEIHRYFLPNYESIQKVRPDFLVMVLDTQVEKEVKAPQGGKEVKVPKGEKEVKVPQGEKEVKNSVNLLPEIIKKIQEFPDYSPFIFLFNCGLAQGDLQKKYNYKNILTYQSGFDFNLLQKVVEKFEAKRAVKESEENLKKSPRMEKKFYIGKEEKESVAFHPFKIKITGINETTINFKTTYVLDDYMVLKMEFPSKFWFTVLPPEKGSKPKVYGHLKGYTAAINGIGEIEKNQLRVYINKVFVPKEPEEKKAIDQKGKAA